MANSLKFSRFDNKLKELKIKGLFVKEIKRQIPKEKLNDHVEMLNKQLSWSLFILKAFNIEMAVTGPEFWHLTAGAYTERNKNLVRIWVKQLKSIQIE